MGQGPNLLLCGVWTRARGGRFQTRPSEELRRERVGAGFKPVPTEAPNR